MAIVRKSLDELQADPPKLTPEQRDRLDAMTDDDIDAAAKADDIGPEWSDAQLERAAFARDVRRARENLGLTQSMFAERFHIALRRLHDWERGRHKPDTVAAAYIKTILHNPKAIEDALKSR